MRTANRQHKLHNVPAGLAEALVRLYHKAAKTHTERNPFSVPPKNDDVGRRCSVSDDTNLVSSLPLVKIIQQFHQLTCRTLEPPESYRSLILFRRDTSDVSVLGKLVSISGRTCLSPHQFCEKTEPVQTMDRLAAAAYGNLRHTTHI